MTNFYIYENLYDVLNKRETKVGSVSYVRIAVGRQSESCLVHKDFKVMVIVDTYEAHHLLPAPFLNRFEKHALNWSDMLNSELGRKTVTEVKNWVDSICGMQRRGQNSSAPGDLGEFMSPHDLFFGYHAQFLHSLVATVVRDMHHENLTEKGENLVTICQNRLMWMLKPEGVLKILYSSKQNQTFRSDLANNYFAEFKLNSLAELIGACENKQIKGM